MTSPILNLKSDIRQSLQPDTFVTQRLQIQKKLLTKIAAMTDTMLTYYVIIRHNTIRRIYSMAIALRDINAAFTVI